MIEEKWPWIRKKKEADVVNTFGWGNQKDLE